MLFVQVCTFCMLIMNPLLRIKFNNTKEANIQVYISVASALLFSNPSYVDFERERKLSTATCFWKWFDSNKDLSYGNWTKWAHRFFGYFSESKTGLSICPSSCEITQERRKLSSSFFHQSMENGMSWASLRNFRFISKFFDENKLADNVIRKMCL